MQKRTLKVALLAVFTVIMVLGISGVALAAPPWSDLPDTVTAKYGITDNQVAAISEGFPDGTWRPFQAITRAQFTKMAVEALNIPLVNPATPSFTDVAKGSLYYQYIEAAKAAGAVNGTSATQFSPNIMITRQQALAIIARYVAKVNGIDLATKYTAAEIDGLLAHFKDKDKISADLKDEMAFAYDFGITQGDASGNLNPLANLTRIQAAAMLIRAAADIPPANFTPAKIEIVNAATSDKGENLIGQVKQVTFKVTTADGHPAVGVLVDFDTLLANDFYVGNITTEAGVTNSFGEVTVDLISTEPGTERVAATVVGVGTIYTTQYWLVLDQVYTVAANNGLVSLDNSALPVQSNATTSRDWSVRVVVFGPGPRSTSAQDWYNAISKAPFDPNNIKDLDGINSAAWFFGLPIGYEWDWVTEHELSDDGFLPRTLAGITVNWSIIPIYDPDAYFDENPGWFDADAGNDKDKDDIPSVGAITAITNGGTVAANGQTASGPTDASGLSKITIKSDKTGFTPTMAIATYPGNPYPNLLYNHIEDLGLEVNFIDWEEQPEPAALQLTQWTPHVIGGQTGPLALANVKDNTGEEELVTLTLKDTAGNAIPGYQVKWNLEGVGVLKNADLVTNAAGLATATLYSSEPGQSIVETKILDKSGLPAFVYTVVKQWYQIDDVAFTPMSAFMLDDDGDPMMGVPVENAVGTEHTFVVHVSGLKWVWTSTDVNENGLDDDEVLVISRDSAFNIDGVLLNEDGTDGADKDEGEDLPVQTVMRIDLGQGNFIYVTRFTDANLQPGEYWADINDIPVMDPAEDIQLLWSSLAGKGVDFFNNIGDPDEEGLAPLSNTPLPVELGGGTDGMPEFVGTIKSFAAPWVDVTYGGTKYHYDAVTDANGLASVTVTSTNKGDQYIYAVVDYPGNPQSTGATNAAFPLLWGQLKFAAAEKVWVTEGAPTGVTDRVFGVREGELDGEGAPVIVEGNSYTNPIIPFTATGTVPLTISPPLAGTPATGVAATIAAGVVTGFTGLPAGTNYTQADVGQSVTALLPSGAGATATATVGVVGSTNNAITQISVTAGGSGYTVAPTVVVGPPQIAGGTTATATAHVSGGSVVSVTVDNPGSGYTAAPAVSFTPNAAPGGAVVGTIATVVGGQVATITPVATVFAVVDGSYPVTFPALVKTTATGEAQVTGGVVTGVTLTNAGAGYVAGQTVNVTVGGGGTGAFVQATVNADGTISLTLLAGGSGYGASVAGENPNRETLAVEVFDKFGNSLPDYKVVWQIVQQGTTTSGTIPTYHPFAHFENVAHDSTKDAPAMILDAELDDINPIWNGATPHGGDDDKAIGYTLNGQINFTLSLESAAHVDLVMDEPDALLAMAREDGPIEFTDIVNVTVYAPNGSIFDQFTQIKTWVVPPVPATQVHMFLSTNIVDITGPWVTSLTTDNSFISFKIQVGAPDGSPAPAPVLVKVSGPGVPITIPALLGFGVGPDGVTYVLGFPIVTATAGTYTFTPYIDADFSGTISNGDIPGAPVTLIIP